jgi:hypothetical protein
MLSFMKMLIEAKRNESCLKYRKLGAVGHSGYKCVTAVCHVLVDLMINVGNTNFHKVYALGAFRARES